MQFGCSLNSKTFMPEFTGNLDGYDPYEGLILGYDMMRRIGYDYIEASVGVVTDLSEAQLRDLSQRAKDGSFNLRYCNCFIPGRISLYDSPEKDIHDFVDEAMRRFDLLKVRSVVFGSGTARRCPDGMEIEKSMEKITAFLTYCNKVGEHYGIKTVIENLNRNETNILNTVKESVDLVRALGLPYVVVLADLFHMTMEQEDTQVLTDDCDMISHIHVAEAPGRVYPGKLAGAYFAECVDKLHTGGFDRDVSVECTFGDMETEAAAALRFLKEMF